MGVEADNRYIGVGGFPITICSQPARLTPNILKCALKLRPKQQICDQQSKRVNAVEKLCLKTNAGKSWHAAITLMPPPPLLGTTQKTIHQWSVLETGVTEISKSGHAPMDNLIQG